MNRTATATATAASTINIAPGSGALVAYIRVSSVDQNTARQDEEIAALHPVAVFTDHCSGKNTNRPELEKCRKFLRRGDTLVVHSIDRLCRNVADLLNVLAEFRERGVAVRFLKEGIDTTTNSPMNEFLITILGAVAGFERNLIEERRREGIAIAKAQGKYKGGKPKLTAEQKAEIRARLADGVTVTRLAKDFKVSRNLIYDAKKEAA